MRGREKLKQRIGKATVKSEDDKLLKVKVEE